VLYGITMQESGISKRVAVRFEDWQQSEQRTEDGGQSTENGEQRTENGEQVAEIKARV
jgi:hypothetical protein